MKSSAILCIISCLAAICLFLSSCEKSESDLIVAKSLGSEFPLTASTKVDVCHNDHIINISINAVPAHRAHGDAIDWDGDGYFDAETSCGPTDCDDTDPAITQNPDGDCDPGSIEDLLPGTWVTTDIVLDLMVGELTVLEYLTSVLGLSEEDANARLAALEAELIVELEVTLVLYDDNTYESFFAGGSDSGTWSLSADETTLTLFEGPDTIVVNLLGVSETTLAGILSDVLPLDLDEDPSTPDEDVTAVATVTMTRS